MACSRMAEGDVPSLSWPVPALLPASLNVSDEGTSSTCTKGSGSERTHALGQRGPCKHEEVTTCPFIAAHVRARPFLLQCRLSKPQLVCLLVLFWPITRPRTAIASSPAMLSCSPRCRPSSAVPPGPRCHQRVGPWPAATSSGCVPISLNSLVWPCCGFCGPVPRDG